MKVSVKRLKAENKADLMAVFDKLLFSVTSTCSLFDSILIDQFDCLGFNGPIRHYFSLYQVLLLSISS